MTRENISVSLLDSDLGEIFTPKAHRDLDYCCGQVLLQINTDNAEKCCFLLGGTL
jgi:hypothetical protein